MGSSHVEGTLKYEYIWKFIRIILDVRWFLLLLYPRVNFHIEINQELFFHKF
jgi:hypothetical protein